MRNFYYLGIEEALKALALPFAQRPETIDLYAVLVPRKDDGRPKDWRRNKHFDRVAFRVQLNKAFEDSNGRRWTTSRQLLRRALRAGALETLESVSTLEQLPTRGTLGV